MDIFDCVCDWYCRKLDYKFRYIFTMFDYTWFIYEISIYYLGKSSVYFSTFHMIKIKDGISTKQELNRETSIRNQKFTRIFRGSFFDLTCWHYKGLHEIRLYFSSNYVSYHLHLTKKLQEVKCDESPNKNMKWWIEICF